MLSDEIIEKRRGNITASGAHAIMADWSKPAPTVKYEQEIYDWISYKNKKPLVRDISDVMSCEVNQKAIDAAWSHYQYNKVPSGLLTYAEQLACEELFEPDPSVWDGEGNAHIENGMEREIDAMLKLSDVTGLHFDHIGDDQIHICEDNVGATPDGISFDESGDVLTGAEVKCRSPLHHARQLFITDNESLLKHDSHRYCQVQVSMYVTNADYWYSANYNPYAKNPSHQFNYCIIYRDVKYIDVFKKRAAICLAHKAKFLEKFNNIEDAA